VKTTLLIIYLSCFLTLTTTTKTYSQTNSIAIDSLEMHLSNFGVETLSFPSIDVYINFIDGSNHCKKWNDDPAFKDSIYTLNRSEIKSILELVKNSHLEKLKTEYKVPTYDLPSSTTIIYTSKRKFVIKDYGLQGEYPLKELYKIVYKF
jgi:hypothetical protein